MSEILGREIQVGLSVENVRGTAPSTAEKWIRKITATIVQKSEKKVDETTCGNLADSLGAKVVKKWFEGDIEGNVQVDMIGYLLYNIYGAVTTASLGSSVYGHTFSLSNTNIHSSLSIFAKDGANSQEVFDTGMINTLGLSIVVDDYVKFTAGFIASDSTANSDTPSCDTEYDFIGKDVTVKFSATEGGLAGATATKVKELNINWETGLIADHVLGSYTPDDIYNSKMMIEGDFTMNYVDDTFKDYFTADTYQYMQISIVDTSTDLGGGTNPTMTILLNRVSIMDWSRDGGADELVTQSVSFKAFYNATDSEQSTVVLNNLTTEYDTPLTS